MSALGLNQEQICSVLKVSVDTLQRRVKEGDSRIAAAISRGRAKSNLLISKKAYELAMGGNAGMIKYILSCQAGWSDKPHLVDESDVVMEELEEKIRNKIHEEEIRKYDDFIEHMTLEENNEYQETLKKQIEIKKQVDMRISESKEINLDTEKWSLYLIGAGFNDQSY